jgi:hypothetical protein
VYPALISTLVRVICTIYEVDEHDDEAFIAMEYLEGVTLKHMVASRPLEAETCFLWQLRLPTRSTPPTARASSPVARLRASSGIGQPRKPQNRDRHFMFRAFGLDAHGALL